MPETRFHTLFTVTFFHKYYNTETRQDFDIVIDIPTSLELICKQTQSGFIVLYREEKQFLLEGLDDEVCLSFDIKLNNRYFHTFTDIEQNGSSGTTIYSNKTIDPFDTNGDNSRRNQVNLHSHYSPRKLDIKSLGVIDIFIGGEELTSFQKVLGSDYVISFDNRLVFWKYNFITNWIDSVDSVKLYLGAGEIAVSEPEKVDLANGQKALRVTSKEPLPLQQNYQELLIAEIGKVDRVTTVTTTNRIKLPTPDVTRIKGVIADGIETFYSDMYIYF